MSVITILLIFWPYLFFLLIYLSAKLNLQGWILGLYFILTIIVNIINIIYSCKEKPDNYKKLIVNELFIKLFHIPYYLLTFIIGIALLASAIVPALLFITPTITIIIGIINYILMITSSSYGINALIRLKKSKKITNTFFIINSIMHLIFV